MAEALGAANNSRVVDITASQRLSELTPAYAIFDDGDAPVRAALFNYVTDPSGASDLTIDLAVVGTTKEVKVKCVFPTPERYTP